MKIFIYFSVDIKDIDLVVNDHAEVNDGVWGGINRNLEQVNLILSYFISLS